MSDNIQDVSAKTQSTHYISNSKSFYYGEKFKNWSNTPMNYALDIAIENYISKVFEISLDRIIYSSLEYCFRERTRKNEGMLNIPFYTYYRTGMEFPSDRPWFNNQANLMGLLSNDGYEQKLGGKLKVYPCRVSYESSIFFSQQKDCEYAMNKILTQVSNETILFPMLETNKGDILKNVAIANFDVEYNPEYQESDWLEQNRIWSISIGLDFDTFMIGELNTDISVCKEVAMNFIAQKGLNIDKNLEVNDITILSEYFGE